MNLVTIRDVQLPSEDELHGRIARHLAERGGREDVVQAWDAYLSALLEWGLLHHDAYRRLIGMLPAHGREAIEGILLGFDGDGAVEGATHPAAAQ